MKDGKRWLVLVGIVVCCGLSHGQESSFLRSGDVILCVGDSITHQNGYEQFLNSTLRVLYPDAKIRVVECGVNGAKSGDGAGAVKEAMEKNKATVLTLMFGVNDTRWQTSVVEANKEDFLSGLRSYAAACREKNTPVVFLRESCWSHGARGDQWATALNKVLDVFQANEDALAKEIGVPFIDVRGAFEKALAEAWQVDPRYDLTPDIIHPNSVGHVAIASEILRALGAGLPLAAGDRRGDVRVERSGSVSLTIVPAHGSLPAKGEVVAVIRVTNTTAQPVSGVVQAVVGTHLCKSAVEVPANTTKDVAFKVPADALPGRWGIQPLYAVFSNEKEFAATGMPFFYSRSIVAAQEPVVLDPGNTSLMVGPVDPVKNLRVQRTADRVVVKFDWIDKVPVAAKAGFKNRFGQVVPYPLDLKVRGAQPCDAVELLFDLRPPESIGRPTADADSNPDGVVRVGIYREQDGADWKLRTLALPEVKAERLKLTQNKDSVTVEFMPDTAATVGFSMRVSDRAAWTQDDSAPACLTFTVQPKPIYPSRFEYLPFLQLGLGEESISYRVGY